MVMLHNGADHTPIAMHDQPARKPLSRSVNRVMWLRAQRIEQASPALHADGIDAGHKQRLPQRDRNRIIDGNPELASIQVKG